jgi:glycosyltransferase involved in cell wall biosynthesis
VTPSGICGSAVTGQPKRWTIPASAMTAPCLRLDLDVANGVPDLPGGRHRSAWLLVRMHTEPLGRLILRIPNRGLTAVELQVELDQSLGEVLRDRARACGADWPQADPTLPLTCSHPAPYIESRAHLLHEAPTITVVVCSRERPTSLARCLSSLVAQVYPRYSILVIDSAPRSRSNQIIVEGFSGAPVPVRYAREPRPGLSRARNRGLELCQDEVLAWIDDDEIADRHWLAELARALIAHPAAAAVSGPMVPASLETWAEVRFEQYGGHSKLRGFRPITFDPQRGLLQSPFYPLPAFATGGNVAMRTEVLRDLGGLDQALGAGTPTRGGADTRLFTEILCAGRSIVYQPTALTHHFHRQTMAELRRLMYAYGAGLSAYYTSMLVDHPGRALALARLLPDVRRDAFTSTSRRSGKLPPRYPPSLRWANRLGLASGPARYFAARSADVRLGRRT